jgi:dihydroorotate dehydrogenase (NAD+) catalytic subunit
MVYQVAHAVQIPVVGLGGISSAENILEMMMAGARAVEVGSANLIDPWACQKMIEELPACMEKYHIESLEELG